MWYGVEYVYGGGCAHAVYEFSSRRLRDVWVAAAAPSGPRERAAIGSRDPLVRYTPRWARLDGDVQAWRVLALARVERTPELARHRPFCLYGEDTSHYRWLATAPAHQIVSWAEAMAKASVE